MSNSGDQSPELKEAVRLFSAATTDGNAEAAFEAFKLMTRLTGGDPGSVTLPDFQFRMAVDRESDRGAALFTAAYLDTKLESVLRSFFVQDEPVANAVLRGTGGLSSFSARIDATFLVGVISKSERANLHIIRKIRNDFAHHPEAIDFSFEPIGSRCRELGAPWASTNRERYVQSAMGIVGALTSAIDCINSGLLPKANERPDPLPLTEAHETVRVLVVEQIRRVNLPPLNPDE